MKKISFKINGIVLITFICLISVIVSCNSNSKKKENDKVSLRLQWFHLSQFAGFYSAEDEGYYKGNNINITINPGGPDFNAITLVANGNETFGVWTADQILIAQSKGVPITIIAAIYRKDPNVLMVKKESSIYKPSDFKGKTITTVFGRSTETVLKTLLEREGISEKDVKIEPFPFNLQSFIKGDVDVSAAYVYDHPYQAQKLGQEVRLISPYDYGINFYSDCIFVRNDLIEKNPDLCQRFINATLKGWNYALSNKNSAVISTIKRSPQLDKESQFYMLNAAEPLIKAENPSRIGLISEKSLDYMIQILIKQNQIPRNFEVSKSYSNRFVDKYYENPK